MAEKNTTAATNAAKTKAVAKKPASTKAVKPIANDVITEVNPKQEMRVKSTLTPNTFVTVKNGFSGRLVYKSSKTNEKYVWESFGEEQDIELQELRNAKSAQKVFFENNWFLFDDPEVIVYLGVEKLYANALDYDEFDALLDMSPEEISEKIASIPEGQKQTLAYKCKQMIASGEIDSMKMVNTLEKSLGVELIER